MTKSMTKHSMTKRVKSLRILATAGFLALSVQAAAFGWGKTGHRIVGQIAENHLSGTAAGKVKEITGGRSLAQIANWPDFIRSERSWSCSYPWHYINVEDWEAIEDALPRKGSFRDCRLPKDVELPQNLIAAIDFFSEILAGDETKRAAFVQLAEMNGAEHYADSVELSALSFLVHFIGDLHQPLHVGRGGDLGGNKVAVLWFGEDSNLHSVWDEGLIEYENLSYTEFAAFLEAESKDVDLGNLKDVIAWAEDARRIRPHVYEIYGWTDRESHLPDLGYQYTHDQRTVVHEGLYRAGRRLAARLSSIF